MKDDRRERFAIEYIKDLNATEAAKRAGYSPKTAYSQGSRLLKNVEVQNKIRELNKRAEDEAVVCAADVLRELGRIALCDIREAFNEDGTLKGIKDMPANVRRAISGFDVDESADMGLDGKVVKVLRKQTKKVRFWNKGDALNTLAKHFHLLDDKPQDNDQGQVEALLAFLKSAQK
jgi:phage terminase small subunit